MNNDNKNITNTNDMIDEKQKSRIFLVKSGTVTNVHIINTSNTVIGVIVIRPNY